MKTFEEAFAAIAVQCEEEKTGDGLPAAIAHFSELGGRYRELLYQCGHSPELSLAIRFWIAMIANDTLDPASCLFTVFTAGLITGIEMEKAE